jgi:pimeloyl-ACP methyl ester carboxylesterase
LLEGPALWARFYKSFGRLGARGPENGPKLMVVPGFIANDRTTLGCSGRSPGPAIASPAGASASTAGSGRKRSTRIVERLETFGGGKPVILVGWSLGGVFAREAAKRRPDLVAKVITPGVAFFRRSAQQTMPGGSTR